VRVLRRTTTHAPSAATAAGTANASTVPTAASVARDSLGANEGERVRDFGAQLLVALGGIGTQCG
jgi:hypothetical protein